MNTHSASNIDLMATEPGNLPLSFLKKSPWYIGKLMITKNPHNRNCKAIVSQISKPPSLRAASFNTLRKQNKLSNAKVANKVSIGEEVPNSIISFSWRLEASSSVTLVVIIKVESENPKCFKMVSMQANK